MTLPMNRTTGRAHNRIVGLVRARPAVALTVAALAVAVAIGWPLPIGIVVIGIAGGGLMALNAMGIALVHRGMRVINFAQLSLGGLAALLFAQLVERRTLLFGVRAVCKPCLPTPEFLNRATPEQLDAVVNLPSFVRVLNPNSTFEQQVARVKTLAAVGQAPHWMVQANYWLSLLIAVSLSVGLAWLFYVAIMKRFTAASRLVLTVITIGAGTFVTFAASFVLSTFFNKTHLRYTTKMAPPIHWSARLDGAVLGAEHVLTIAVAIAASAALALFFRRSLVGVALRGAADNADRARTLGIEVETVTGRAWVLAALLASLAAVLAAMWGSTDGAGAVADAGVMARVLVAASVGGLVSLPAAAFGGMSVGLIDQAMRWGRSDDTLATITLFVLVVAVLLVQRQRAARADSDTWDAGREMRPIPPELRSLATVRRWLRFGAVVLAAWILAFPWVMSPPQVTLGTATMLYAIVGLSLLVLAGWAGQLSMGQMGFAAVGGWAALAMGLPFPLAVLTGAVAGGLAAVAVGIPALRLRGLHLAITTLGFTVLTSAVLVDKRYLGKVLPTSVDRPVLLGLDLEDVRIYYYAVLVLLAVTVVATAGLRRSRTGRVLMALKDNEAAVQTFGINLARTRLTAYAVSGAIAGFAGALLAFGQHGLQPITFGPDRSLAILLTTIVGGLGSVSGPLLGAGFFGFIELLRGTAVGPYLGLFFNPGVLLVVVFLTLPGGLVQAITAVRDAWLRRLASRRRIVVPSLLADRRADPGAKLPIAPKTWASGASVFVPERYRLTDEWVRTRRRAELETKTGA
jgi:branched-chain amino acid transport system permease protein